MKTIKQYLKEGFADNYGVGNNIKIIADNDTIYNIVQSEIKKMGYDVNLNHIDVSRVTDMCGLFRGSEFNGDISGWDVSNVYDMRFMFTGSEFNGDISKWNVSRVENMGEMFEYSQFTGDISKWNTSSVRYMYRMFTNSKFTGDISKWNVSRVENMSEMFRDSQFTGDISKWNVSRVTNFNEMFKRATKFKGDISKWVLHDKCSVDSIFTLCPAAKNKDNIKAMYEDYKLFIANTEEYYNNPNHNNLVRIVLHKSNKPISNAVFKYGQSLK